MSVCDHFTKPRSGASLAALFLHVIFLPFSPCLPPSLLPFFPSFFSVCFRFSMWLFLLIKTDSSLNKTNNVPSWLASDSESVYRGFIKHLLCARFSRI